jgi:hypothetical protein
MMESDHGLGPKPGLSKPKKKRKPKGPNKQLPPRLEGVDPRSGPLTLVEAAGDMRKAPGTVRKLANKGEIEWCGDGMIWGPSIDLYWTSQRARKKAELEAKAAAPVKRKPGRPRKVVAEDEMA